MCRRIPDELIEHAVSDVDGLHVIVSSSYSGIGSAEWSLQMITKVCCLMSMGGTRTPALQAQGLICLAVHKFAVGWEVVHESFCGLRC